MSIKLLAIDIDGTLLTSGWEIPPANSEALGAAHSRGVEIVLVTGRRLHTARLISQKLPCPVTLIVSNGALIFTPEGEVPYRNLLPRAHAREAIRVIPGNRGNVVALFDKEGKGQLVMEEGAPEDGPVAGYLARYPQHLKLVPSLEKCLETDPIQLSFVGPVKQITQTYNTLRESSLAERVHITKTDYSERDLLLVDILNRGCNKGTGLAFWAARGGVDASEIMAMGDNFNDIEMLQFAGLPIVMGTSVLASSNNGWPVTASSDEDGVAVAVRKHILT